MTERIPEEPKPREYERSVSFDEIGDEQTYKASVWVKGRRVAHAFEGFGREIKEEIRKACNGDLSQVERIFLEDW